jgi:hypothetical protein
MNDFMQVKELVLTDRQILMEISNRLDQLEKRDKEI